VTVDIDVNVLDATGDRILAGEELKKENVPSANAGGSGGLTVGAIKVSESETGKCGRRRESYISRPSTENPQSRKRPKKQTTIQLKVAPPSAFLW